MLYAIKSSSLQKRVFAGLIRLESKQNKFLHFGSFLSTFIIISLFHALSLTRIRKQGRLKPWLFFFKLWLQCKQKKNIFFFVTVSFLPTHYYFLFLFLCTKLERNNKTGKTTGFFDHGNNTSKSIFVFCICFPFTRLVLCFVFHAPYSKVIGKLVNSLLLLVSFLTKPMSVFSIYTP